MRKYIASICCFLVLTSCTVLQLRQPYPTDDEMTNRFYTNRQEFEDLLRLFREDTRLLKVGRDGEALVADFTKVELDGARSSRYRDLLTRLGLTQISRIPHEPNEIYLKAWGESRFKLVGGRSKYYVSSEKTPNEQAPSLDRVYESGRDANEFRRITGDWYLYLDVW